MWHSDKSAVIKQAGERHRIYQYWQHAIHMPLEAGTAQFRNEHVSLQDMIEANLLIMTSNAPEGYYSELLEKYRQTLSGFVGPTKVFVCGDTLQLKDYSKTDWPWYFDGEAKQRRHETVFPEERRQVYQLGAGLVK